jgi:hypothetical protein
LGIKDRTQFFTDDVTKYIFYNRKKFIGFHELNLILEYRALTELGITPDKLKDMPVQKINDLLAIGGIYSSYRKKTNAEDVFLNS